MSTRPIVISGVSDNNHLLIKPASIYYAADKIYANAKYFGLTTEEIVISMPREYAEYLQQNAIAYKIIVKQGYNMAFSFGEQGSIDKLAVAMGAANIDTTTPGHEKILLDSNNVTIPDGLWIARTAFVGGAEIEFCIWKGQCLNPQDMNFGQPSGTTDFSNYGIGVEAIIDSSRVGNNLGYFDYQV